MMNLQFMKLAIVLLLSIVTNIATAAVAIQLTWAHPTTRTDGSVLPATERSTYEIYSKPVGATTSVLVATVAGTTTIFDYVPDTIPNKSGNWCFTMTTTDKTNTVSSLSGEYCLAYKVPMPVSCPKTPTGLRAK